MSEKLVDEIDGGMPLLPQFYEDEDEGGGVEVGKKMLTAARSQDDRAGSHRRRRGELALTAPARLMLSREGKGSTHQAAR